MKDAAPHPRSVWPPGLVPGFPPPTTMKKLLLPILLAAGSFFALAQDPKPAAPAAPAGDAAELTLGVIPNVMKYDKAELTVKAGVKVKLTFKNEKCALMHNFLLLKPGTRDAVGALADQMLADPQGLAKQYCPVSDNILVKGSKLLAIGQTDVIEFTAPAEAGDYPYICTFPGHWRLMQGVMHVTK